MSASKPGPADLEAARERIRDDTPFWAEHFAKIVTKKGELVPFTFKPGQLELDARLEAQRAAGKPPRAIALKARQVGISTYTQAKLMHRCTLRARFNAIVVAHDRETGAKLFQMAETVYANLPSDGELKPRLGSWRRGKGMHFEGESPWMEGGAFPDSRYLVDTAGEFEAGRGGTYRGGHLSEIAFWPQIMQKYTALTQAFPDDPETLLVLESTANGYNAFKDLWDDAEAGRSNFIAFFWPWWRETEYVLAFANETERELFVVGDPSNRYAEREPELVEQHELTLEQLNWRRSTIADKCGGDMRIFDQEYPTVPEDAFMATGRKVFDPYRTAQIMVNVDITDPKRPDQEHPGPKIGDFEAGRVGMQTTRTGEAIEVAESALFVPREAGIHNPTAPARLWLPDEQLVKPMGDYIVSVDVSGGKTETTRDVDYHAIEVIDHRTREQVAEYRSRIEPEQLTPIVHLIALFFNEAWVAVERTGSWGLPILRRLWFDYHYPYVYRAKSTGATSEKTEHRLGWDTNVRTKPLLVAGMAELIRIGSDGIKSRELAGEMRTLTRDSKGAVGAEPGKFDDLAMAYMIAQQLAAELPFRDFEDDDPDDAPFVATRGGGLAGYDPRYAR